MIDVSSSERSPNKIYRSVSDLRIQFICEYRFHLQRAHKMEPTKWADTGAELHHQASSELPMEEKGNPSFGVVLLVIALISAVIWIFW